LELLSVTLSFHALWMLCALGAVVFAAAVSGHVRDRASMAGGLLLGIVLASPSRLPDPAIVGSLAAAAAAVALFRPRYAMLSAACGGALAGMWSALLEVQGLPAPVALTVVGLALVGTAWLARTRPRFAPELLRDEGLLAIAVLGLGVAVMPAILDGWQAAGNLSVTPERQVSTGIPMWTLTIILMSASLGALYSFWSRR
jgi:hypothetical protein